MKYYHGSDVYFKEFVLNYSGTRKDFGIGIYLQEKYNHAEMIAARKPGVCGYVYTYDVNMKELRENFVVQEYRTASIDWVKFVLANRSRINMPCNADIVIGPTADAITSRLIRDFVKSVAAPTDRDYRDLALQLGITVYPNQICLKSLRVIDYFNSHRVAEGRIR